MCSPQLPARVGVRTTLSNRSSSVRRVVKEQVESLGARFIEVPDTEDAQTASGYAREVSEDTRQKQAALIRERMGK